MKIYDEVVFMIDIISTEYNTKNAYQIKTMIYKVFGEIVPIIKILLYLNHNEERISREYTLQLNEIFNN